MGPKIWEGICSRTYKETIEQGFCNKNMVSFSINGQTKNLSEWAKTIGVAISTVTQWWRLYGRQQTIQKIKDRLGV